MPNLIFSNATLTSIAKLQNLDNQEHLVVPVIAIKEGVLNDIFYSNEEINSFAQTWNGVPIPVGHPERDGSYTSANAPEFDDTINIGKFFNANFADGKLKGEIWINVEKARRLGYGSIIDHFNNGKMMEVSTGLFSDKFAKAGTWNEKKYTHIVKNIRPDHIALLPNAEGACSIEDGCGAMRTNGDDCGCDDCTKKHAAVNLRERITNAIKSLGDLFNQEKELSGKAVLSGNSDEVVKAEKINNNNNEAKIMSKEAIVAALIANAANIFKEKDKDSLLSLDLDVLTDIHKRMGEEKVDSNTKDDPATKASEEKEAESAPVANTEAPAVNTLSDDDIVLFNRLKEKEQNRVAGLRTQVVNAYKTLSPEIVANMSVEAIEGLVAEIKPAVNFSGRGGSATINANGTKVKTHRPVLFANTWKDDKDDKDDKVKEGTNG